MDAAIRRKSLTLTILIHGLILLALLFFVISTRVPPFEEGTLAGGGGGGTIVDFGELDLAALGTAALTQTTPVAEQASSTEEDVITSENEETTPVVVHKKDKTKKIKENKVVKKTKTPVKEVKEVKVQIKVPIVDPRNVFHPGNSKGSSPTASSGNQGQQNGQKGGSLYTGSGGNGSGPGTGGGNGSGNGPGIGPGNGPFKGITWGAGGGRNILSAPQFKSKTNEPGKVTLKIFVDENGSVTRVERSETQTLNPEQVAEAIDYVKKVKFSKGSGISIAYPTIEFSAK